MKNIDKLNYTYTHLPKKPDILVNIHIGHTDSSVMNKIITKQYNGLTGEIINCTLNPEQYYPYGSIRKLDEGFFNNLNENQKDEVQYTSGHIGLEILNFISNKPTKAFAIIKEPKSLLLSNYWATVQSLKNLKLSSLTKDTTSFIKLNVSNLDTMLLQFIERINYDNNLVRWFSRDNKLYDNKVPITDSAFQEVIYNIKEDFLFVGLSSKFDESVVALRRVMNWRFDEKLFCKIQNTIEFKMPESSYTPTLLDSVDKRFTFEKKLYTWVEERFNSLIKLLGDDFDEEVRMYKRLNYIYQKDAQEFAKQLRKVQKKYTWATELFLNL